MTEINWPEGWTPHADRDASEPSMRERAERAESVARGQQKLIEAQRVEVERLDHRAAMNRVNWVLWRERAETAEAEVERLRAENADRESELGDLRDRVEKAEAAVGRVEALRDEWEREALGELGKCPDGFCGMCTQGDLAEVLRKALSGDQ